MNKSKFFILFYRFGSVSFGISSSKQREQIPSFKRFLAYFSRVHVLCVENEQLSQVLQFFGMIFLKHIQQNLPSVFACKEKKQKRFFYILLNVKRSLIIQLSYSIVFYVFVCLRLLAKMVGAIDLKFWQWAQGVVLFFLCDLE